MTRVRRAEPRDALAVADVHMRAWQQGYRSIVSQAYLDGLSVAERAENYTFDASLPDGPVTLVAEDAGIAGFVTIGRCRDDGMDRHGEVWAMYVDPGRWRGGVGRLLIAKAREELSANGFEQSVLWVLEDNLRARRFYESDGWTPDEARRVDTIGGAPVTHVRYVRALG
ncbi:GNAT family N-acetyltransferase [Mycolicibacterium sp. BiH015]|uniref:GNAT family N-acetyltransferase n=1 Tax=Mycolicibacterium sp. BiH015 TaxID=3018808 RepID=UPI0022E0B250|nr:GNAT family N-acetyltransferase [Mycolicibacterium sp. BiH015]MDA2889676.1 GNAT family N-acetyltransferase [Mycolicibacterium sp. BiH015]